MQQQPDVSELWIQHQRRNNKTSQCWACTHCDSRKIFLSEPDLWRHFLLNHRDQLPAEDGEILESFRRNYAAESEKKRPTKDDSQPRKPSLNPAASAQPEPPPALSKRPLSTPGPPPPTRSLPGFAALNISTSLGSEDVPMQDVSDDSQAPADQPRKRVATGDGISAGSGSPCRNSSASPPPRRSKARPTSAPYSSDTDGRQDMFDTTRRQNPKGQLWTPDQEPLPKASFDPSNIASLHAPKQRAQGLQTKSRKPIQSSPHAVNTRPPLNQNFHSNSMQAASFGIKVPPTIQNLPSTPKDDSYDIVLQPETRPISQEQLVAEVKGIYAGLVMVEAKCIEVDNKQATLAQADPGAQPKLNNEQWQALIALHRTLLHEHHDFFLASQHPSASPALRRLASKYAMPARMWRHGIHSFLELLRHRLPASLDHMLAFIYLAYSMMALLYETVPAFEDTWIECLGDLGRYRMAIEDDDIRDREVWTGVARHWYSKASDKAPTTGRLYHHLAILARPNALQQLFYYSKSLCVVIPFSSARESILTLFEPVLNADNGQGQYRLPPLDTAFVKAHGLLFTGRDMIKFEPAVNEFLGLLDSQIGRVTRKFMEQGYQIAVANSVAMLGFASKENAPFKALTPSANNDSDVPMADVVPDNTSASMVSFKYAQHLSNSTLKIVLQRIGDPNVLPFIHVTLVFMYCISRHPVAMSFLQPDFPWELLSVFLNTLLGAYDTPGRIEKDKFPLPEKDDVRPFPEDFAIRGLLWASNYFPDNWFINEKIDEEEKQHERASMTAQRKERIMWLACRIANLCPCLIYDGQQFSVPSSVSRSSTFASATTVNTIDRAETWTTVEEDPEDRSDAEEDLSSSTMPAAEYSSND